MIPGKVFSRFSPDVSFSGWEDVSTLPMNLPWNLAVSGTKPLAAYPSLLKAYVFPPFVLIGPLLKYLCCQRCTFSIVVPDLCPKKFWWPLVQRSALISFILGSNGVASILLFPAKSVPAMLEPRPLQWDLWVFRIPSA